MAWTKEQQQAINEFGTNIIVSAGAGSGKTAVLSERVLEHVKNNISIDEMLILTFTNAAAQEMKERIRKKLIKNNFKEQAEKIDLAYITTFDSYALSILKKYSYTLNMSKNISIIDNSVITLKKEEILQEIFDNYYEIKDKTFLKLIDDFCLKDDKEIFDAILSLDNSLNNIYQKDKYLNEYIDNYYNEDNINNIVNEYLKYLHDKLNIISRLLDSIQHYVETDFYYKYCSSLNDLLHSKEYKDIKYYCNNIDSIRLSNATEEASLIKNEISKIIKDIKELTNYNNLDEIKETIYSTKDYVSIIIDILIKFNKKINSYKMSILSFEFCDIAKMAIKIISDNETIRNEIKSSYKEILIDEYQDTNDLQDIFISLIENNNQYMVGDIKQSIYRFRNANPLLFKTKYEAYSKNDNGLKIDLNKNFRSRKEVLSNINLIFNLIMDNSIGGANYLDDHQMIFGQENYLQINNENYDMEILNYNLDNQNKKYTKTEIEIFTIAKDIKCKIDSKYKIMDKDSNEERSVNYSDFAILLDRSKHFNLYKKIFEFLNIPVTIMKDSAITDNIDIDIIKNIYNLIICVKNKEYGRKFKYSYMSLARSFLFEIDDNDILKIFNNKEYFKSDIYNIINNILIDIDSLSNKEIYERIIKEFDIYNKIIKVGNINTHLITLDYIQELIETLDGYGYTYIDFYNYLDNIINKNIDINLSLNKDSSNSVKIMTIHTSKGLEYPICYFASMDEKFNLGDLKEKFLYSNHYGLITPYVKNDSIKNTIVKVLMKNKYFEDEISEKIRLFYVALTRVREKMIFVASIEDNILAYKENEVINNYTRLSYRSLKDILDSIYPYIKKYIINVDINDIGLTKLYNYQKITNLNIEKGTKIIVNELEEDTNIINKKRLSKEIYKLNTKEEKENMKMGIKFHQILEYLDFNNPDISNLNNYEKEVVNKFLDTKIFVNAKNIYKEFEFFYNDKDELIHGIIDLLLVFDNKNIIIDYKLKNTEDEAYIKQLDGYKKYVNTINNNKTEIYVYSIMEGELIKIK